MARGRAQEVESANKRGRNTEEDQDAPAAKRPRSPATGTLAQEQSQLGAVGKSPPSSSDQKRQSCSKIAAVERLVVAQAADDPDHTTAVDFWVREGKWPRKYFDADMEHILSRKRLLPPLRRKRSESDTSTTPSDQKPREEKSAPYRDSRFVTLLAMKGSFMNPSDTDIRPESQSSCMALLTADQPIPAASLFEDGLFMRTCRAVMNRNEARVLRDISPLVVPPAEILAVYGSTDLECLIESTNEGWNNSIPLVGPRPQPDYSVGFRREAFTADQLSKMSPVVGDFLDGDLSFFMATYYMYFPFLTCEVKCGAAALDVADRQNAHSMTLAARAVVELFRVVKRENEVDRKILSFSISHDDRSVRIYGHYPVIDGKDTKYYRHPIHAFDMTVLNGKERWTAYRFVKNVYHTWMPEHFKSICSAIDELPTKVDFDVPALSESTQ